MTHQALNSGHSVTKSSLKLVRHVLDRRLLDVYKNLEINKGDNDRGSVKE